MPNDKKPGCRVNDCGKPFAPLEGGRTIPQEDDFRACVKHEKELRVALQKLLGNR